MKVVWTLFRQNQFINLVGVITITLFFMILLVLLINLNQAEIETSTAYKFKDNNIYKISDNLIEEVEDSFFSELRNYDLLHDFITELIMSSDFNYYNAIWQPIGISDFKGSSQFEAYYEINNTVPPYEFENEIFHTVKSIQLNSTVLKMNNIQLNYGRFPDEDEYMYSDGSEPIPILLGSDYSTFYEVGDLINIDYYNETLTGQIIGILDSSQKIMTFNDPELLLDRYIIFPSYHFKVRPSKILTEDSSKELFIRATLLSRLNGEIITKMQPHEIRKTTNLISSNTNFDDFQILGANSLAIDSIVRMTETNKNVIFISLITFVIVAVSTYLFIGSLKLKKNIDTYKVLLISGSNFEQIYRYIRKEILLTSLVGMIIPLPIIFMLIKPSFNIIIGYLITSTIFISFLIFITNKFIKRNFITLDIVQKLKG